MATEIIAEIQADETIEVTILSGPGPAGLDGGGGGSTTNDYTAGVTLSGHRAVTLDASGQAIYCDAGTLAHARRVAGVTTGAASSGAAATVQHHGEMVEPSWTWDTTKPVYLGLNGVLTQTVPTLAAGYAFSQVVGWPRSATILFIDLGEPITLT